MVLRFLRGKGIDALPRDPGVTAAKTAEWRDRFLDGGQANLKNRQPDVWDGETLRVCAKAVEQMLDTMLLDLPWLDGRPGWAVGAALKLSSNSAGHACPSRKHRRRRL